MWSMPRHSYLPFAYRDYQQLPKYSDTSGYHRNVGSWPKYYSLFKSYMHNCGVAVAGFHLILECSIGHGKINSTNMLVLSFLPCSFAGPIFSAAVRINVGFSPVIDIYPGQLPISTRE